MEEYVYSGRGVLVGWQDDDNPPYAAMKFDDATNWQAICGNCGKPLVENVSHRDAVYAVQRVVNAYCPHCNTYRPQYSYSQK